MITTSIMNGLFLGFTDVSESLLLTKAAQEPMLTDNSSLLNFEKKALFAASFEISAM